MRVPALRLAVRALCAALALSGLAREAGASHATHLGSIDFIDATFGIGGGSLTKSLTSGADDGWIAFAANSGDTLSITLSASSGTSGAPAAYDGAVLLESTDGVVAVGDDANITDFSFDRMGAGTDLVVQHQPFNPGPAGSYQFDDSMSQSFSVNVATTGQYVIGIACSDETCVAGSAFTATLSGNTAAIPEPGTAALFGLGLFALARARGADRAARRR